MSDHQLALQEIEKFVKVFKAFEEAKNAIIALASLDQNVKELVAKKQQVQKELDTEKTNFENFKLKTNKLRESIGLEISLKRKDAEESHQGVLEQYRKEQDKLVAEKQIEQFKLNNILEKTRSETVELQQQILKAKEELEMLETKLVHVRRQINKILVD